MTLVSAHEFGSITNDLAAAATLDCLVRTQHATWNPAGRVDQKPEIWR